MSRRSHYTVDEVNSILREKFPYVSQMAIATIQEQQNIQYVKAGCDTLTRVSEMDRLVKAISETKFVRRSGFLVLPDSFRRS
jgi:hypothetical protein